MSGTNIYKDNEYNVYRAYSYTLLLQIEQTLFSYAIVKQNKLLLLVHDCELQELIQPAAHKEVLKADYDKVIIGLPASGLSVIPKNLFNEGNASGFARLLDVKPYEKVMAQSLDNQNVIIYKTNENISSSDRYNLDTSYYNFSGWIKAISKSNPPDNNLYLDIDGGTIRYLNFKSGALRFHNTFEFKGEDDLAYYTALVTNELHLKPQRVNIIISGDADIDDKNLNRLAEFYLNIELTSLQAIQMPPELPAHKYLSLVSLLLCGSSEAD